MKLPKGLETTEMVNCQGCGEYHPITDCEIVVIRVIKGKNCQLNQKSIFGNVKSAPIVSQGDDRDLKDLPILDKPVIPAGPVKKAIPPQFAGMMLAPDNPDFERFGAKEQRK